MTVSLPKHLAVIPDGNRRWARALGKEAFEGHEAGIARVAPMAAAAWERGIEVFTIWWGSPANLTMRSPAEVEVIVGTVSDFLTRDAPRLLREWNAGFDILGRWRELCPGIESAVDTARAAAGDGPRRLVLLMGYDGRDEIVAAAEALGGGATDRESFQRALWTGHLAPVDLVLRTGGEPHLSSGFMMWWMADAQFHSVDHMWPAVTEDDLDAALARYGAVERRLGK